MSWKDLLYEKEPKKEEAKPLPPQSPVYFPVTPQQYTQPTGNQPSFVVSGPNVAAQPQQQNSGLLDPDFVHTLEEEITKQNLPGQDYFEFRQVMVKTQAKFQGKIPPDQVLSISLDAFGVPAPTLIANAQFYKDKVLSKVDDFIKGGDNAKAELQSTKQGLISGHENSIRNIEAQLQQLEAHKAKLIDDMSKIKIQLENDKNSGAESIEIIQNSHNKMLVARDYVIQSIENDIHNLQSIK